MCLTPCGVGQLSLLPIIFYHVQRPNLGSALRISVDPRPLKAMKFMKCNWPLLQSTKRGEAIGKDRNVGTQGCWGNLESKTRQRYVGDLWWPPFCSVSVGGHPVEPRAFAQTNCIGWAKSELSAPACLYKLTKYIGTVPAQRALLQTVLCCLHVLY
jgi:hypothetical protein